VAASNPAGAQNIQSAQAGTGNCMPMLENGVVWLNGVATSLTPNASGTLANAFCSISNPTLSTSGNQATLTTQVTFNGTSGGTQAASAYAADVSGLSTGWVNDGSVAVQLPTNSPAVTGAPGPTV